jgi:isoquinoline 1-oxidoreductase beta subunit
MTTLEVTRRQFLKATTAIGGGLALEFSLPGAAAAKAMTAAAGNEVTHWIFIYPDDRVVIRVARSEMGQGSLTGLAQLVAEELECDWHKVSTEFASPNEHIKRKRIWGSMSTGGSAGIRTSQEYLRKSGASAREMLVSAAATQWNVPAGECTVASGVISHAKSKRKTTYGKVAEAAGKLEAPKEPKLKDPRTGRSPGSRWRGSRSPTRSWASPCSASTCSSPGCCTRRSRNARCSSGSSSRSIPPKRRRCAA